MKKTEQQIKNLRDALVWWKTVPEKNVDLDNWRDEGTPPYTCNTICCFGGWCAVQPLLVAQGVHADAYSGAPITHELSWATDVALEIFGDSYIFSGSGNYPGEQDKSPSHHHAQVTRRIKRALADSEQG